LVAADGALLKTLVGHSGGVVARHQPDGRLLASGSETNHQAVSLPDGTLLNTLAGEGLSLAISPDGRLLVSGSSDATIKLWSLPDGRC